MQNLQPAPAGFFVSEIIKRKMAEEKDASKEATRDPFKFINSISNVLDFAKNPSTALLVVILFGYSDLKRIPDTVDEIHKSGIGALSDIKLEIEALRVDLREQYKLLRDSEKRINDDLKDKEERIQALERKVNEKTFSKPKI